MLQDRGADSAWITAQIARYETRVDAMAQTFQEQETPRLVGVLYNTKAP
jgi:hypothetical protein